ncbi:MAG: GMC family oxidoreductase [Alphaproteobacteria bacterium]|nr:MAG: GMC family oxidoreductase [Alphaproteobacteria bacterium]
MRQSRLYDVIIVGSGAGGGMSAYVLSKAGLKILMLEAGRDYDPEEETPMFEIPADAPLRAVGTPDRPFGYYDATIDGGWEVPDEPYTVAKGEKFKWWRSRMLGGRTNHWGRISLRFGPYDFKPFSRDGLGFDWPISYEDVAPYYDKTETLIGVCGSNEGLENTPDSSPGVLQPPPKPRAYEHLIKRGFDSMDIKAIPVRIAILTKPLNGRSACFYATDCSRGCSIKANFQTPTVLLPPAMETGNLEIVTDAMVYKIDLAHKDKVRGVTYIDKKTGKHISVEAKVVVLAASAPASSRILLNSRSELAPQGVANSSGKVGRYLMDTVGTSISAHFPALEKLPAHNEDGISREHLYVPWWGYQMQARGELDFPRGYHIEWNGGRLMPEMRVIKPLVEISDTAFGPELKSDIRRTYGSVLGFSGRGEMIPNDDCYCEIDTQVKDKWGIPVLKFHWKWSQHETRQAGHMRKTLHELVERMGGTVLTGKETDGKKAIKEGGAIIHEIGSARMGDDPANSVLNQYCQAWDQKNLFIMDGASFVSNPDKNPTLTILALAWRSSDYLVEQFRKGSL